ncbi:MAG: diacylglycerol kinase family protein [Gammaproteobacteria bacterium]|uniref:Diacylglycerol kinase (ATP) n=1 Tax=Tolumonas osonensis TaxID=675874 RepID=A0A841GRG4_9GAMM|nr:diacylglycerol kinase family protein [Tolumonas osonensis]MBB6056253.1 diacylglycerol kinase (ATP) [Tolumonas osonensis]NCB60279.1 diacylglycerol kinase family protein [Gammaproteobacteria bacterium]
MSLTHQPETFSVAKRVQSIRHAVRGVTEMLKSEHNAWVHLFATVCVVLVAAVLSVNATEWCFLILAIMAVWVSEALNTAFEFLCDVASPDFHPLVKKSKDVAAGAVLLSAIGAVIIALIIFVPHIVLLL